MICATSPASCTTISPTGINGRPALRPGNDIVFAGDSITYNCSQPYATPSLTGYCDWALALSGQRAVMVGNAGHSGDTSTALLARFAAEVVAQHAAIVVIEIGVNDPGNSITAATSISNIQAMSTAALNDGSRVILMTVLPRTGFNTAPMALTWGTINNWIREYSRKTPGVYLADVAPVYIDNTSATPIPLGGYTGDGTHPNEIGAGKIGAVLATTLGQILPAVTLGPAWNKDPANYVTNGLLLGSTGSLSGGATGTSATGWQLIQSGSGTACAGSKVARTDGVTGEWQQIVMTGAAPVTNICQINGSATLATVGLAAGDTLYIQAEYMADVAVGNIFAYYQFNDSGFANVGNGSWWPQSTVQIGTTGSLVLRSAPIVVPATAAYLIYKFGFGGNATGRVGRVEIRKVATP